MTNSVQILIFVTVVDRILVLVTGNLEQIIYSITTWSIKNQ